MKLTELKKRQKELGLVIKATADYQKKLKRLCNGFFDSNQVTLSEVVTGAKADYNLIDAFFKGEATLKDLAVFGEIEI